MAQNSILEGCCRLEAVGELQRLTNSARATLDSTLNSSESLRALVVSFHSNKIGGELLGSILAAA